MPGTKFHVFILYCWSKMWLLFHPTLEAYCWDVNQSFHHLAMNSPIKKQTTKITFSLKAFIISKFMAVLLQNISLSRNALGAKFPITFRI